MKTIDVYITTRAAPSGGFYAYVRSAETHQILTRTGLTIGVDEARARASRIVSGSAYRWHRVPPPDDAPPLFPDGPADTGAGSVGPVDPDPTDLELAADTLRANARGLRDEEQWRHMVGTPAAVAAARAVRHADAATLDLVADWLRRTAAR